jgi:hypothetical protein
MASARPRPAASKALSFAALLAAAGALAGDAAGAVRLCEAAVSSGIVTGSNEETARAGALAVWKSKARAHGEPYASWRIAAEKILRCLPKGSGGYECLASARPCTIEQAPDRRENRKNRIGI